MVRQLIDFKKNRHAMCKIDFFQFLGKRGPRSQSAMHAFDKITGVLFYSQVGINGVACWNSAKPFTQENHAIIARNDQTMIYPGDLNVCMNVHHQHGPRQLSTVKTKLI